MKLWLQCLQDRFHLLRAVLGRRILRTILVPILLVAIGTAGYCLIDDRYTLLDAART